MPSEGDALRAERDELLEALKAPAPTERAPRPCCDCGVVFQPTSRNYRCKPCRHIYDDAWRKRRRANGKKVNGRSSPERERAWRALYNSTPERRARRAELMREYRKRPDLALRRNARAAVRLAIKAGTLVRQPCEVCGVKRSQAHHDDYSRPLDVRWLCATHHAAHHAAERALARSEAFPLEVSGKDPPKAGA